MKKTVKKIVMLALMLMMLGFTCISVSAADNNTETAAEEVSENQEASSTGNKAIAAAIAIGLAAGSGAIGMGIAIAKSVEGISRQPEAEGKIRTSLMLGLVFVETAIIYALIVAILIVFVL